MNTPDNLTIEVRDRIALAQEQLRNLHDEILRTNALPGDTSVAIAIAEHHLESAQAHLRLKHALASPEDDQP
jgi:hypothetical protein